MKKILSLVLVFVLAMSLMAGCGNQQAETPDEPEQTQQTEQTQDNNAAEDEETPEQPEAPAEPEKFELSYPAAMAAQGYETLVLDAVPQRIVCTATAPVLTLHEMGASIIAMPSSSASAYILAENPDIVTLASLMSEDFNIENVVALEPDLVILSTSYADSHGATLESLGINVYYQAAGHGVSYETVKEETMCLIDAFSIDDESMAKAESLKQSFENIEATCASLASEYEGIKIMVIQAGGVGYVYGQTSGGTLGSMMNMLGFENVADATAAASMFEIDYETALAEQPELLVVLGSGDAAATETMMNEIIATNPDYWNAMTAITEGNVLYLGREYIAVYGIGYVTALESLVDTVAAFYEAK